MLRGGVEPHFACFAVKTLGPWCKELIIVIDVLGKLLVSTTGEIPLKKGFFKKNISLAIQRDNGASGIRCFNSSCVLD